MSLIQFLSVSRTVKNLSQADRPYHLADQGFLPKFNAESGAVAQVLPPVSHPLPEELFETDAPKKVVAEDMRPSATAAAKMAGASTAEQAEAPRDAAKPALFPFRRTARQRRAAVQGELSLSEVKVMRNDLSDADLEAVPARDNGPSPYRDPQLGLNFNVPPKAEQASGFAWGRFVGRLFMAGRVRS